jgi:hypothetical protein
MQPQGQQMPGMGMQMGQPMQQPTPPETQSNMQPIQNENQVIVQQPGVMQAPDMVQNGNMNMSQPQIYENPPEPKQETAAAPPPPPNGPPFGGGPGDNNGLNVDPITNENLNDLEKNKADYAEKVKKYLDDLSPAELDIFKQEVNKKPNPSPIDMQSTVM